jgi:hypothetical protein
VHGATPVRRAAWPPRRTEIVRDASGQIASWLIRLILILVVVGFVAIEFGAVVVNKLQVQDIADQTAAEAGIVYVDRNSIDAAEERAVEYAEENDAEFVELRLDLQNRRMLVTLEKSAGTRVLHRIGALEGLVTARAMGSAPLR